MSVKRVLLLGSLLILIAGAGAAIIWQANKSLPRAQPEAAQVPAAKNESAPGKTEAPRPPETAPPFYAQLSIRPEERIAVADRLPAFDAAANVEVPFTALAGGTNRAALRFRPDQLAGTLVFEGGTTVDLPRERMPLALLDLGEGTSAIFARELFSGRLWLYRVSGTRVVAAARIVTGSDAQPMLRAATVRDGRILAVLYDNARSVNELVEIVAPEVDADVHPVAVMKLPSLEDPSGLTYEMIPGVRFVALAGRLYVVGGTLLQEVPQPSSPPAQPLRWPGCLRAQDLAILHDRIRALCLTRATGAEQPYETGALVVRPGTPGFRLVEWSTAEGFKDEALGGDGLPFLEPGGELAYADTPERLRTLFVRDLRENHASGVMELGSNNIEGRVAWSQIYFLNGLMDILSLAASDEAAARFWQPLLPAVRLRLDIEIYLLDRLMASDIGFRTKAFTVARAPAIFAVQTSRLLLLFNRYERLSLRGAQLSTLPALRHSVLSLENHIDVLATAGPDSTEPAPGRQYLHWPKGSAFYFDGLNVPYNHQNEWAYAVFDAHKNTPTQSEIEKAALGAARDIISQFLAVIAPQGQMPASGMWRYWGGKAGAGWTSEEGISNNMPAYPGDKLPAAVSFRSIDVMSVLSARQHLPAADVPSLSDSIAKLVNAGLVFPFVAAAFDPARGLPLPNHAAALSYARMTAPSDLQSSVYAYYALARGR